ncbi:MAG: hypothetical protein MUE72_07695 [Chitinophagaceae bacterium]|jgi:hypothetical protein|nr:hypothetical protein [Chitinophagaceae bacterium]
MQELDKINATIKNGKEPLTYNEEVLNFSILDFWRWSVSDLLSNATRGRFAEFIVATSINICLTEVREEWDKYDLITSDGIKIEVKSASYLQSWSQKKLSTISFSTKAAIDLENLQNNPKRHADVYVFCLLKHDNKKTVDPLNMNQWEFYILATKELNYYKRSQHSITLKSLQRLTQPIAYDQLEIAIRSKHKINDLLHSA